MQPLDQEKIEILLVDAKPENLSALDAVLASPGYRLVHALSGLDAMQYLTHHEPAVILMNVQLPELDGFQTASMIKGSTRLREIPVIFITPMRLDDAFIHKCYEHGAADYITEPVDAYILKSKVAVFADLARKAMRLVGINLNTEETLRRNKDHSDFLARASLALSSSLDYDETLAAVARLAVSKLADGCTINLLDAQDNLKPTFATDLAPAKTAFLNHVEAIATGKPILEPRSMVIPLIARNRVFGTLGLILVERNRSYDAHDLELAADLARRAATAIDSAQLYRRAQAAIHARDEFLSIASHELKTPITPLKIQTQSLMRALNSGTLTGVDPKRLEKMLSTSDRQLGRLTRLVDDLLDFSRISSGQLHLNLEQFNLTALLRDVVDRFCLPLLEHPSNLTLSAPDEIIVHWDRFRIERVMINLLTNAMKFGAGKPIQVSASVHPNQGGRGELVRFAVKDHGIGISAENQKRVFGRFERAADTKTLGSIGAGAGLGLGLYVVAQILVAHGGKIEVESNVGAGSTFTVELPATASPQKTVA